MVKMTDFLENHPLSDHYKLPPGKTAKELVNLLLASQKAVFGQTVIGRGGFSRPALTRNMKLLMKKYSIEDIKRGIGLSVLRGQHPASTKFIEDMILWRKELIHYTPYTVSGTPTHQNKF